MITFSLFALIDLLQKKKKKKDEHQYQMLSRITVEAQSMYKYWITPAAKCPWCVWQHVKWVGSQKQKGSPRLTLHWAPKAQTLWV